MAIWFIKIPPMINNNYHLRNMMLSYKKELERAGYIRRERPWMIYVRERSFTDKCLIKLGKVSLKLPEEMDILRSNRMV